MNNGKRNEMANWRGDLNVKRKVERSRVKIGQETSENRQDDTQKFVRARIDEEGLNIPHFDNELKYSRRTKEVQLCRPGI